MGRGLVEPVDDHRATNPATHPQLLDALARELVDHGFDLRHLIKTIVSSRAYQRSSRAVGNNLTDDRFYSKAIVRPLSPVVMVDAVSHVTGIAEKFGATPMGTKAIELGDAQVTSVPLDLLGRCSRVVNCEAPESVGEPSLSLSLHVINGEWLNEKIAHPDGRLLKLVKRASDIEFITRMYELCYSRKPDKRELRHWREKLHAEDEKTKTVMFQDFMWALLNSTEFCTNH